MARWILLPFIVLGLISGIGRAVAGGITLSTPSGLSPGDTFRFVFVTDGFTSATSSDIADYNNFVNTQAGRATYNGSVVTWDAIGSTSSVNAIDNVGQSAAPLYLADGTFVTSSTTSTGLWSGSLQHAIDEDLSGALKAFLAVFTGTTRSGVSSNDPLGNFSSITDGDTGDVNARWVQSVAIPSFLSERMYGISQVLTVVPEPSSLWLAGTGIIGVSAFGWSRKRWDQQRQSPVGPTYTTE